MNYIVTARKWRPQIFEDVIGQEHISKTLKNAILNNRLAHAYIFAGPRGVGKTTTARILAKSLNCLDPQNGEPCNKCDMCNAFHNTQSLDVIEIDGASNRRIDEIRTLRESVKYAPTKGNYKIYIIDEVHMLTTESFNALLKTLEEPPEQTVFIFATTDIHKVPITIISRCQRFDFRRIELKSIMNHLQNIADAEKIIIDQKSLLLVAKKADGALRDAQSLFDQVVSFCGNEIDYATVISMMNLIDEDIYFEISDSILNKEFKTAFTVSSRIYDSGWNFVDFLNELVYHFRNIMSVVITKDIKLIETSEVYQEKYKSYSENYSESDLLRILSFLNKVQYELKSVQNQRLKIEVSLCHLIGIAQSSTIKEILSKVGNEEITIEKKKASLEKHSPKTEPSIQIIQPFPSSEESIKTKLVDTEDIPEEIKSYTKITFNAIEQKWQDYLEEMKGDMSFGVLLKYSKPLELNDKEIVVEIYNSDDISILLNYKSKVENKTNIFFGFKKEITFKERILNEKALDHTNSVNKTNTEKENSLLINAVIETLQAVEIT